MNSSIDGETPLSDCSSDYDGGNPQQTKDQAGVSNKVLNQSGPSKQIPSQSEASNKVPNQSEASKEVPSQSEPAVGPTADQKWNIEAKKEMATYVESCKPIVDYILEGNCNTYLYNIYLKKKKPAKSLWIF